MAGEETRRLLPGYHHLAGKTIAVAGGGVAGLAFTAAIRKLWDPIWGPQPRVIIFDRDAEDVDEQREGYSLSLSGFEPGGGLVALQKLGLLDGILKCAVSGIDGSGSFKIWGPDWSEHASLRYEPIAGLPTSSLRIARKDLRRVLLGGAVEAPDMIRWQSQCLRARPLNDGRIAVRVLRGDAKDGAGSTETEQQCDLLVAADGASSKLRSWFRPDDVLEFSGAVLRGGLSRFDGPLPDPLGKDWGFMMSGTGVSGFFSPVDEHSIVWGVGHLERQETPWLDRSSPEALRAVVEAGRALGAAFQQPFRTIVDHTDLQTVMCINARDKLPFSHDTLLPRQGGQRHEDARLAVVFIGDANHALSPFAGYGANLALSDGWDLAEKLCEGQALGDAVAAYDRVSVPRAARVVRGARRRLRAGHSTGWRYWIFWLVLVLTGIWRRVLAVVLRWRRKD